MNIRNMSGAESHDMILESERRKLESDARANPRCRTYRRAIIEAHRRLLDDRDNLQVRRLILVDPYLPSVLPIQDLQKRYIRDLRLEIHHRGSYVLLRAVKTAVRLAWIQTVMEDEENGLVKVSLHQQEEESDRSAADIIPVGTVLMIKEPYLSMSEDYGGLRVDHISDLIWLSKNDERVPLKWRPKICEETKSVDDWKREGDDDMNARNYYGAIHKYSSALSYSRTNEEIDIMRFHRSQANLMLRRYEEVLEDTKALEDPKALEDTKALEDAKVLEDAKALEDTKALEVTKSLQSNTDWTEKRRFQISQALSFLGRFDECRQELETILKDYSSNHQASSELVRVKQRLNEQDHGSYDFKSMRAASKTYPQSLANATYIGSVEIRDTENQGLGIFTTQAVKIGELLMCEKAFCSSVGTNQTSDPLKMNLLINPHLGRIMAGSVASLVTQLVQKLQRNPSMIPTIASLYHGSYISTEEVSVDDSPIIDTFLVEQIVAFNSFACPSLASEASNIASPSEMGRTPEFPPSCGIWPFTSRANHSCYSNSYRSFIGDMQITRATRDIPANTEVTIWYRVPYAKGCNTAQQDLCGRGFECTCVICVDDKKTTKTKSTSRENLLGDLKASFDAPSGPDLAKVKRTLLVLEKTYKLPATRVPRLALWESYMHLVRLYAARYRREEKIYSALKLLECLGFELGGSVRSEDGMFRVKKWGLLFDRVIEVWMHLRCACVEFYSTAVCDTLEAYARLTYRVCRGEEETFDENMGDYLI